MRIYVGNIPFKATQEEIGAAFAAVGSVNKVDIVLDRETGRPRGFAFVYMDDAGAQRAIEQLNGQEFGGRRLVVNTAKDRGSKPRTYRPEGSSDW